MAKAGRPRKYGKEGRVNIQVRSSLRDRLNSAKDKVSKSFGFTLDNTQFMEYMLNKVEEDIKSKGAKNPHEP